jgi:hypothetical protein
MTGCVLGSELLSSTMATEALKRAGVANQGSG